MFKEARDELGFAWGMLGDVVRGRPNLGEAVPVTVYRLMQFTLRDVLIKEYGPEAADRLYYQAGRSAGRHFFRNLLTRGTGFNQFVAELQRTLAELRIGILRMEKADLANRHFVLTVAEDLECSGLPACGEHVCVYDEGFINGLFLEFTGEDYEVKEIDCWCSGDRTCRFEVKPRA